VILVLLGCASLPKEVRANAALHDLHLVAHTRPGTWEEVGATESLSGFHLACSAQEGSWSSWYVRAPDARRWRNALKGAFVRPDPEDPCGAYPVWTREKPWWVHHRSRRASLDSLRHGAVDVMYPCALADMMRRQSVRVFGRWFGSERDLYEQIRAGDADQHVLYAVHRDIEQCAERHPEVYGSLENIPEPSVPTSPEP
jgi:hypothetical protein